VLFYGVSLMAALPYMQLYVADYLADTMHLTAEEHGAYLLLIMNYWQTGKPLSNRDGRLASVARVSNERWTTVERALSEFFEIDGETWKHKRIEKELEHGRRQQKQRSDAGRASAKARTGAGSERPFNDRSTNPLTDTDTDTDKNKKRANAHVIRPDGVDQQVWDDFVAQRKTQRAPITETALRRISLEAEKAGITLGNALEICLQRGWRGFEADWVAKKLTDPQGRISDAALQTMHNLREYL
jgi:uncharacterized protein YdaU (DUF1376 family)